MAPRSAESGGRAALVAAALQLEAPATLVVVTARPADVDKVADDLALFSAASVERFAAWESSGTERSIDDQIHGDRLRVLKRLAGPVEQQPAVVVASIQSLLQPVPSREQLLEQTRSLTVGAEVNLTELLRWFAANGFDNTPAVQLPGEFSLRGGIVDVFAPDWDAPVRIEFFDERIESIRAFEVSSQRSLMALDSVEITILKPSPADREHLASYLAPGSWWLLVEPDETQEEARHYLDRVDRREDFHSTDEVLERIHRFPSITAAAISRGSMEVTAQLRIESVERFSGDIGKVRGELDSAGEGQQVTIVCRTEAEIERLSEIFASTRLMAEGRLTFVAGSLAAGFRLVAAPGIGERRRIVPSQRS